MEKEKKSSEMLEGVSEKGGHETSPIWSEGPRLPTIRRKVDLRLCLTLACRYVINQIDRSNLSVAMVAGMGENLKLTGSQYSMVALVFFPNLHCLATSIYSHMPQNWSQNIYHEPCSRMGRRCDGYGLLQGLRISSRSESPPWSY